jgi:glycosyltransferase involved in cell wall biosynthesis
MASYNGARWLPAQLESLAAQDHPDWALRVSDDGSTDATPAIVAAFARAHPDRDIAMLRGPGQGAAANFLSLLCRADLPLGPTTLVALSDQDDIWRPDRLSRAAARLAAVDPDRPAIWGAQSVHVDEDGRPLGRSRRPRRPVTLGNALVQNMVSGHTATLNPAAVRLARRAGVPPGIGFHDWWLSLLVTAAGGAVLIDPAEVLLYRQHRTNAMGAPEGIAAALRRAGLLFRRDYAGWIAANAAGLRRVGDALPPATTAMLDALGAAPGAGPGRVAAFARLGLRRQGMVETALLWLAAFLGRA